MASGALKKSFYTRSQDKDKDWHIWSHIAPCGWWKMKIVMNKILKYPFLFCVAFYFPFSFSEHWCIINSDDKYWFKIKKAKKNILKEYYKRLVNWKWFKRCDYSSTKYQMLKYQNMIYPSNSPLLWHFTLHSPLSWRQNKMYTKCLFFKFIKIYFLLKTTRCYIDYSV